MNDYSVEKIENQVEEVELKTINEETYGNNDDSNVIKDYFYKETGLTLTELAKLFGQSEDELSREFGTFKAKKLFAKLDYSILEPDISKEEFVARCKLAQKYGFKSVSVYPTFLSLARALIKDKSVKLRAIIPFFCGEENYKVKLYAVKSALSLGADEVVIPASVSAIKNGRVSDSVKEFKKFIKVASKKRVVALVDKGELTSLELEAFTKAISSLGKIHAIMVISNDSPLDAQTVKDMAVATGGKCYIEGGGSLKKVSETVMVLSSGAEIVSSKYAVDIAKELEEKINS